MRRGESLRGSGGKTFSGSEAFLEHYRGIFGGRWQTLEAALVMPTDSIAFEADEGVPPYHLDSASVFAASSLELPTEGKILDACAAPGGKSLVLASRMGELSRLMCYELSPDRRRRLVEVLDRHLGEARRSRVDVRGGDAAALCRRLRDYFDAILLDAPCSSERHVLADPNALAEWRPGRVRGLVRRQWALLSSAFIMLKPGGCLVYSTCALSPEENDGVASRLAAKYGASARFDPPSDRQAEATEFGVRILPDAAGGAGPMYVCRVRKAPL